LNDPNGKVGSPSRNPFFEKIILGLLLIRP
jgi:hypothetical protein